MDVQLIGLRTLRGPNFWSPAPVTRLDLAVGGYDDISSAMVEGVAESLAAELPGLIEHRCNIGSRGGFLQRLRRGTYIPHIVEHLALELQTEIGHDVGFGRARGGDRAGEYVVVYEHRHSAVGRRAGALALALAQRAFAGQPPGAEQALEELRAIAASPDEPVLVRRIACGITGSGARAVARAELLRRGVSGGGEIVELPPSAILESGLPYSDSELAVILDADPGDVPERYRDPDLVRRLVTVLADAVPRGGTVIAPDGEPELHEMIERAGRKVRTFEAPAGRTARATAAASLAAEIINSNFARVGQS